MELRIAEKLKELRRDRGNTQEDIANHLGISVQAISKQERGDGLPGNSKYKLSADEMKEIYSVFIEVMLTDAAVSYKEPMNDEQKSFFTHNGI